jgi:beta-lactamase regulating signal transducer with metallopeptidase domain
MTTPDILGRLDALGGPIATATVRGAIILLVALFATQLLRRRSAATRHAIWSGAIAAQLLVLALGIWGPRWRVATPRAFADIVAPVVAIPDADVGSATPAASVDRGYPSLVITPEPATATAATRTPAPTVSARITPATPATTPATTPVLTGRNLLLLLWLGGALFVAFRLAVGTVVVATLARRGARVDDGHWLSLAQKLASSLGIDRPLILMRGKLVSVPITWGIVYPIVLLPDDADAWTEERRRFVLVHEMAHVKRLDALTQLVGQIALAIFWFNPLVWIANRRMQLEREHACDDYVLRHGTVPSLYAEELLEMVRSLGTPGHGGRSTQPAFAALAMARRSEFEGRMLSILDPVLDRHPLSRGRTMIGAVASLLVVIPLAALQPYRAAETGAVASAPAIRDELPESFKISIHDVTPRQADTSIHSSVSTSSSTARGGRDTTGIFGTTAGLSVITRALAPATKALAAKEASLATSVSSLSVAVNGKQQSCSSISLGGRSTGASTHIHSDDDSGMAVINYLSYDETRCSQANIIGKLSFNESESDVVDMPSTAHAVFRERTAGDDRELTLYRTGGGIVRVYRHNGADASYDDDARRWFARFLPGVLQEATLNVGPRVARWRDQGGVNRVLEEIAAIHSSGAKRAHYEALLEQGHLSNEDTDRIVKQASRDISSSGDLSSILTKAAPSLRNLSGSARTLAGAIAAIPSSGDRTAVLQVYGATDNKDVLLAVMRVAKTIPSSGDLASLLSVLAPKYLAGSDAELRNAWFDAASGLPSSGDLRNVLDIATGYASRSEDHTRAVLETARRMASSGDRAEVLIHVADAGGLRSSALRDLYMKVAMELPSSGDMRRVLEAASRH